MTSVRAIAGSALAAWEWFPTPVATVPLVHIIDGDSLTVRHDDSTLTIRLTGKSEAELAGNARAYAEATFPIAKTAAIFDEILAS